ncbi:DUF1990 family protein [Actinomadura sp. NPDC049753]|uniref:DUF1990 family protein n=1 Tax=Actinomadura sp. NPDC049753 TaxID=3154739 RepID=UPI003417F5E7
MTAQDFTCPEVGATRDAERPAGYRHMRQRMLVGRGPASFRNAADAVMEFWMHRALPVRVEASALRSSRGCGGRPPTGARAPHPG